MNTIEELILKECPEGVEWKTLGECGVFIRGCGLQKKDFTNKGFPCIHYGQIHTRFNTHTTQTVSYTSEEYASKLKKAQPGDLLIATTSEDVDACCKAVTWLGNTEVAISGDMYIYHHNQNPRYMSYLFKTKQFADYKKTVATGAKVVRVSGESMAKFKFAFPSLSEQEKIANILDKFTSLEAELQTKLQAELEARKKQYEYYRNQLLDFTGREDVEWKKISDFADLKAGKAISASELSSVSDETHLYPCFGGNGLRGYIAKKSHNGEYAIIGRQGALCGCVNWAQGEFYATEHAVVCTPKPNTISRYLYYLFLNANLNQYKSQGAQPGLAVSNLNELEYKIPPLTEQQRIVTILDKFEALINDQTASLAAEMKARHQQYEYYRDKLLTFQRKEA